MAVDAEALSLGIMPGLMLADARARVPELAVLDFDEAANLRLLESLADGCDRYTPMVAVDPPEGLLLDITGCSHGFGGEAALADDLVGRLARLGLTVQSALASSPDAAQALARFCPLGFASEAEAIKSLPVAALRLDPDAERALRRAGLKHIADLAERPSKPLAARFGAEVPLRLARLLAQEARPLSPRRPRVMLQRERRFAEPIAKTDYVLDRLADLLAEAALDLEAVHQGGRRFEARLFRIDGLMNLLAVETSLPTRDPAIVMRLFRERIDRLADPLDPGFGFDLLRLDVPAAERLAPAQLKLEGGDTAEAEIAALIDRLATRLGRNRVRRFQARESHIPEQACFTLPVSDASAPPQWAKPERGEPPLRPLHLFDPPQPIQIATVEVPDGPPLRFRWRGKDHEVLRSEGPERIADEWWRREKGAAPTRDYYRVEDVRGRRFWIFRHGLFDREGLRPRWYLHGLFA